MWTILLLSLINIDSLVSGSTKISILLFRGFLFIVVMEISIFTICKPRLSPIQNQQVVQISRSSDKEKTV